MERRIVLAREGSCNCFPRQFPKLLLLLGLLAEALWKSCVKLYESLGIGALMEAFRAAISWALR